MYILEHIFDYYFICMYLFNIKFWKRKRGAPSDFVSFKAELVQRGNGYFNSAHFGARFFDFIYFLN